MLALWIHPTALWAGAPVAALTAMIWGTHRARRVLVPWLTDRISGHPIRMLPSGRAADLAVVRPSVRPWLLRTSDSKPWSPVLAGSHAGWPVVVGPGWVAVDLGDSLPRVRVPLDRGRFWRDVLFRDHPAAAPLDRDGNAVLRAWFGADPSGPPVMDPLLGWTRLESIVRADPALARATLLDGHLVLPALQAGVPGADVTPMLDHATATAARLLSALDAPWHTLAQRLRLYRTGSIRDATRRAIGATDTLQLTISDHRQTAGPSHRVNGPTLSEFSAAIARAFQRRGGIRQSVGAALRWTPLLAWDDQSIRLQATFPKGGLPDALSITRCSGPRTGPPTGHPMLDRLADCIGPPAARTALRHGPQTPALVELLALSATTHIQGGVPTRIVLDLPTLDTDRLSDAIDAVQAFASTAQRAETQPALG